MLWAAPPLTEHLPWVDDGVSAGASRRLLLKMKSYTMSMADSLAHKPEHPERTAKQMMYLGIIETGLLGSESTSF